MNQTIKNRIAEIRMGKIPEGYKNTKIAIAHIDWIEKSFDNLFSFNGGLGLSREQLGDKGISYLHYGDMHTGMFSSVSYDEYLHKPKCDIEIRGNEPFLLKDGDVVFLDASEDLAGTARCVVVDNPDNKPFVAGLHTFVARPKNDSLSKWYKKYFTQIQSVQKQFEKLAVGFKVYGVNRSEIKKITVSLPPLEEQQKIAEILMKWDEVIELMDKLVKKLEIRKKVLMQKLLKPQKNWVKEKLGHICKLTMGQSPDSKAYSSLNNGLPLIQGNADIYNRKTLIRQYTSRITKIARANSIIMTVRAPVGHIAKTDFDCCIGRGVCSIEYKNDFIYYFLIKNEPKWFKQTNGSTFDSITQNELFCTYVYFPVKESEQQDIADILSAADNEIELNKQKLVKMREQKKALMQLLLTGIVRVK